MKNIRLLRLKFYFDNPLRDQVNVLASFEVKSTEDASKLIAKFEAEGAEIRAAFLNPSHKDYSNQMGIRFNFKDDPTYNFYKGSY